MKIGLEGIAFNIPEHFINIEELACARGIDPAKYTQGLGQKEMSVSTPCEDSVVLAAGAGRKLLEKFNIDPASISHLIVGTETGIDHSTSVSSYVHLMLGLSKFCRVFEIKQACYGAMAGLAMGINYLLSRKAKGSKVLVIATDIARYGIGAAGEPTQGAGAVAMLISDQPSLIEFETQYDGYYAHHVMDFWRPIYSKEAFVDGRYSIQCYLEALEGAYHFYKKNALQSGLVHSVDNFNKQFAACLYHVPYVKMAQKAHIKLLEIDAGRTFGKNSTYLEHAQNDFNQRTLPFLELNSRIGNVYTGSLFISLLNFLEDVKPEAYGKHISLFSYGSGCGAEFVSAKVLEGAAHRMKRDSFRKALDSRKRVKANRYEEMMDACARMDDNGGNVCQPEKWDLQRSELYLGVKGHKRIYSIDGKIIQ